MAPFVFVPTRLSDCRLEGCVRHPDAHRRADHRDVVRHPDADRLRLGVGRRDADHPVAAPVVCRRRD